MRAVTHPHEPDTPCLRCAENRKRVARFRKAHPLRWREIQKLSEDKCRSDRNFRRNLRAMREKGKKR